MPRSRFTPRSPQGAIEAMRRLEGIVSSAMDGIITVNDRQQIILFNPAAERMFGLPATEAVGAHISRFIPERHRADHAAHIQRFAATGVTNRQMGSLGAVSGVRANGEEFPIEASISQVEIGGEHLSTVILRDITERQAAEDALRDSQRRLQGIVESAMDALITVDDEERIIVFNPAAERMFGVDAAAALGSPLSRFLPERFRSGHSEHIRRFKDAGITNRRMGALGAVSALRANGEEFPVEASISQVHVGGAKLATVILRDIAERKANEEARHLLAREVDHRAKNALAVVQALVSLTRAGTKDEFVDAVRGRVSALGRAHSLLARNRWEGGDLAQIVADETAPYYRPGQMQIGGPAVTLNPNTVQPLSLLIHELATNAVKYGALSLETGGVEIRWRARSNGELELRWTESGGPVVEPPALKGFGSKLIEEVSTRQLAGAIDIDWAPDGLQVILALPVGAFRLEAPSPRSAPPAEPQADSAPRPAGGRLLVVEDEALLAMELCSGLDALGWKTMGPAATIDEAMQMVAAERPDMAVLDVNLGGAMVYPLAERLQAMGVPFIFCTGYEQIDDDERFGTSPLLRKPINIAVLDTHLRRLKDVA